MAESIPISLIIAWIIFFGFLNTHQRHAKDFRGSSQNYLLTLNASVLLGRLVTIGLLVYYFMQVAWYWPIALFIFEVSATSQNVQVFCSTRRGAPCSVSCVK